MAQQTLWILNDNSIEIGADAADVLKDSADDSIVTDATITFALKDADGVAVSGATGSLSHVAAGKYRGDLPSTVSLTQDANYTLEITAASSGRDAFWRIPCVAKYRAA
jgi:hypothetical protein